MSYTKVNVSVTDEYQDRFGEVVDALKLAGLRVDRAMRLIGVVSGSIDESRVTELRRINGIGSVESSRSFQIAPPWSDVQ